MIQTHWNDIYHGDAPFSIKQAVVCKAGEGRNYTDPLYRAFIADAEAGRHHAYAYYALHQGTKYEIVQQARRAHSLIGSRPAMFDVENWKAESGSPAGIATLAACVEAIDTYRAAGGIMHVIYLPRSQWHRMGSPNLAPLVARQLHVVNADYRRGSSLPRSAAWDSYGGMHVWAVQYAPCHNVSNSHWAVAQNVWEHGTPNGATERIRPHTAVYTVKEGDTMSGIAEAHHMSLHTLELINPHAGHPAGNYDLIRPGDHLTVQA